jgi:hypothetical protein
MCSEILKQLQRAKDLINNEQIEGASVCIDAAINLVKNREPVAEFVGLYNTPRGTNEFLGMVKDRKSVH